MLAPEWWNRQDGIVFDADFYFHPLKRVESEQIMEEILYDRYGKCGPRENRNDKRQELRAELNTL